MSRRMFALLVFSFLGLGLVRIVQAGYLYATLPTEGEMQQRANQSTEYLRPMLSNPSRPALGSIHAASLSGEQRIRTEREARVFEARTP